MEEEKLVITRSSKRMKDGLVRPVSFMSLPCRVYPLFAIILLLSSISETLSNSPIDTCKSRSCYPNTGNLLIGRERQLSATSTCGLRHQEVYCIVSHLEERKKCFKCDSTMEWMPHINERSHRIENVIHDNLKQHEGNAKQRPKKWWQSENGVQNVSIRLDLEAEFHFTHVIMTFKSFRPAAMLVERSSDSGQTWKIYRYFAFDCAESFPGIPEASTPRKHGDVICDSRYSRVEPSTGGEVVFKVLSPHILTNDPFAPEIQDLLRLTNLRINFTKLHTLGDNLLDNRPEISEKYYYAIYDMVVRGSCSCYGHAEHCIPAEGNGVSFVTSRRSAENVVHGRCQCTHHTKGMNCEECEDFYNDLPWRPAVDREINACKRCECNNHAFRCHFDRAAYEQSAFVSGGVCDDCQHNTMGKNCEQCKPNFYLDPGRKIDDPYACRACECDVRGSLNKGICDSKTDQAENLEAGKCRCKTHVDGERCDRCKHSYWNLDPNNQDGCTPCTCYQLGTYGNEGCNKYTGECTCKRLVTGEICDRCLPEHWGLSHDADGCKPCDCDLGGAVDNNCDTGNGQCQCRPHFTGRRCDQPESGYYCVPLDFYTYEAEDAQLTTASTSELREPQAFETSRQTWTGNGFAKVREGGTVEFTVDNVNVGMNFHVVIRFESQLSNAWENVDVMLIRPESPNPNGPCREYITRNDFMRAVLYPRGRYYEIPDPVCLEANVRYTLKISLGNYRTGYNDRSAFVLIDSIVLVPSTASVSIFNDGTPAADYRRREFEQYQCKYAVLDLTPEDRLPEVCKRYYCPLAASLVEQGIVCNCDPTGSISGICSPKGGQCQCKPMVVGRRCERCAPGTYGFGPQGCTACECNSVGSLDNFCGANGQCKCNDGVYGRQCDQCQPGYWGFPSCRLCQCNGHADICDQPTGACIECRDLTTSHYCDRCQDGYFGDPRIGVNIACRPCPCPGGPASGFQHADTCYLDPPSQNVVCNCRQGYIGERCDKCSINYWGNPTEVGGSCERCDCNNNIDFGVPESCDSKTGRCLKCLYNSEGFQCEHCIAGYFGDAKIQSCQRCICNTLGTDGSAGPCDRVTGQCPCLPNVVGVQCDACAKNHWKIASAAGCEDCACDPNGVNLHHDGQPLLQCNEFDGQCPCKTGRGGRNCGECENYYWGDPSLECKRCECNPTGSATYQCHRENGTCVCLPGSGGAKCDECARGYTGTWPHCQPCAECFQNWDKILMTLKEETTRLVAQAGNIEATGVASVYDKEFNEMEQKLAQVQQQLNTANISKQDVDNLNDRIKSLESLLEGAKVRFISVESQFSQTDSNVKLSEASLAALRTQVASLSGEVSEYEQNATKLRESDAEGAYNITKEAYESSLDSKARADATEHTIATADSIRRNTEQKLETFEREFNQQFQQNQATLDGLADSVDDLNKKIPNLNSMVCGAPGDPCDDLCGGAGCGKCGGPSCGEGALTKSEQAYSYSKEANDILLAKQKEANEMLVRLRVAQGDSEKALTDARTVYELSLRYAQKANDTRQKLQNLLDEMTRLLKNDGATPDQIRIYAQEIMNMTISDDPTEIQRLGAQISENLARLTNIDTILSETSNNLTEAQRLKKRADDARLSAENILNTTQGVIEALSKANTAQTKAQQAIDQANSDINSARDDLNTISDETVLAEQAANDSSQALTALKEDLNKVEVDYLQIDKDVTRARNVTNSAKTKAGQAEARRALLETRYQQAQTILDEKLGDSNPSTPVDRAERLSQKATELLQKTEKYLTDIAQQTKDFNTNDHRLKKSADDLASLHRRLDDASKGIQSKLDHYKICG